MFALLRWTLVAFFIACFAVAEPLILADSQVVARLSRQVQIAESPTNSQTPANAQSDDRQASSLQVDRIGELPRLAIRQLANESSHSKTEQYGRGLIATAFGTLSTPLTDVYGVRIPARAGQFLPSGRSLVSQQIRLQI